MNQQKFKENFAKRNYLYLHIVKIYKEWVGRIDPNLKSDRFPEGTPTRPKIYNQGGSRSGKSWEIIAFIWSFCNHNSDKNHKIHVYRQESTDLTKIFNDFMDAFDFWGLEKDIDYLSVRAPKPKITIGKCEILFLGMPQGEDQPSKCAISYINELVECLSEEMMYKVWNRTEVMCLADWNPSATEHFAFKQKGFNVHYTHTTYLDNKYLNPTMVGERESKSPWDFADSHIEEHNGFKRRVWDRPICPKGEIYNPDIHRRPHVYNIENNTANEMDYLVYSEGIPCGREGVIYTVDNWLDEFPHVAFENRDYGLDFGYKIDPSVLTHVGRQGRRLTIKYETYQCTGDPYVLYELIKPILEKEDEDRLNLYGYNYPNIMIVCDSKDTHEEYHFVRDLNTLAQRDGKKWYFQKAKKPHINTRIGIVNRFKLDVVRGNGTEAEFPNYVYKKVGGISTNIPIDDFNHGMDSFGYKVYALDKSYI